MASQEADVSRFLTWIEETTSHVTIVSVLPPGHAGGGANIDTSSGKHEICKALKRASKFSRLRHRGVKDNKDDEHSEKKLDEYVKRLEKMTTGQLVMTAVAAKYVCNIFPNTFIVLNNECVDYWVWRAWNPDFEHDLCIGNLTLFTRADHCQEGSHINVGVVEATHDVFSMTYCELSWPITYDRKQ